MKKIIYTIFSLLCCLLMVQQINAQADDCGSATTLTVEAAADCPGNAVTGDLTGSTEGGALPDCDAFGGFGDVWFELTATSTTLDVSATGITANNIGVELFDACGGTSLFCDFSFGGTATINASGLTSGNTYLLRAWNNPLFDIQGTFSICASEAAGPPANDLCADAEAITCGTGTLVGTNEGATETAEFLDGSPCTSDFSFSNEVHSGVWYTFTAVADGTATIDTEGSTDLTDTQIAIFSGSCGALTCEGNDDDSGGTPSLSSSLTIPTTAGTDYYIYVQGFSGATGEFNLNYDISPCDPPPPPPTGDCELECPENIDITLAPGACDTEVTYAEPTFSGDCAAPVPPMEASYFQHTDPNGPDADPSDLSYDPTSMDSGVECQGGGFSGGTSHWRVFDVPADFAVTDIDLGINAGGAGIAFTVNLYTLPDGADFLQANLTPLASENPVVGIGPAVQNIPIAGVVPDGQQLVVEVVWPADPGFGPIIPAYIVGYYNLGESADTYISSAACGIDEPTTPETFVTGTDWSLALFINGVTAGIPGGDLSVQHDSGPQSGDVLLPGNYTVEYDLVNNTTGAVIEECSFDISIAEFDANLTTISCLAPGVILSLSENCDAIVGAGYVLQGSQYSCFDNYDVELFFDEEMNSPLMNNLDNDGLVKANIGQEIYVSVTDENGLSCWTTILPEDKTDPVLECPCPELDIFTEFSGALTAESPTFNRPSSLGDNCESFVGTNVFYQTFEFTVDAADTYTWEVTSFDQGDSYLALYAGGFDADNPCDNLIAVNDDANFLTLLSLIMEDASIGQSYTLVMTAFGNGSAGAFNIAISSENGGNVTSIPDEGCVYSCTQVPDLLSGIIPGAQPTVTETCGPVNTEIEDEFIDNDCGTDILRRTVTATDLSGNTVTCTYDIMITQPNPSTEIVFPGNRDQDPDDNGEDPEDEEDDWLLCNSDYDVDADGHPSPTVTGFPTIDGAPIINGGSCDIAASYSDQVIPICNGTTKYYRTWTVVGWCPDFTGPVTALQIIKVVDKQGPTINGIPDEDDQPVIIPTSTSDCSGSYVFPPFTASDNCDTDPISVTITVSAGSIVGNAVNGLPLGVSTVTLSATDDCGNTTTKTYEVEVKDNVPPVMSCETSREISLTIGNVTLVDANVFDDGSSDNCGIVDERVRRMSNACYPTGEFTGFGDKVGFFCCDIGSPVTVVYQVEDAAGNTNECMVIVNVQDKIDPVLDCPDDKPLVCLQDPYDLDLTGYATAEDNCDNDITPTWVDFGSIDNCGVGVITRVFSAVDDSGNQALSCQQTITVSNPSPFIICDTEAWNTLVTNTGAPFVPNYDCGEEGRHTLDDGVEWPADITLDGCGFGLEPNDLELNAQVHPNDVRPRIFEDECDLVGFTKSDVDLPITDGACRKILRTWKVYDWCTFDEDNFNPNNPLTGPQYGYYEYNQIIKVIDNDGPMITATCNDTSLCFVGSSCGPALVDLSISATDECTDDEDLNYSYVVDPGNDGTGSTISGTGSSFINGGIPLGTHRITWTVEDGCGNTTSCSYTFTVSDCKKPTPYANNFMTIELMQTGMVDIWASEINAGSYDNCGVQSVLIMDGPLTEQQAAALSPPAEAANGLTLDCDDVPSTTVSLIVVDVNGLWDYVDVVVVVQDNMNACNGNTTGSIAGTIENEEAEEVQEVNVEIEGDNMFSNIFTDVTGVYSFIGIPIGSNYTITPEKDGDYLNGVTTFDLVLMSKHILNVDLLDSPYKMIAADINKSGTITTFDMVELRKVILFIDTEFQNNTSWRFVDADFVFPNTSNPFQTSFPEVYNVNDFQGDEAGDFVAVKVGDVNCSAQVNPFSGSGDDRSANGEVVFGVQDEALVAGETYTVDFTAADFADVVGYQFTLAFDKDALEFVDVAGSLEGLSANNFGTSLLEEGVITTSWNSNEAVNLDADAKVFSVTFVAKRNAQLSDVLAVNSRYTKAEAYDSDVNLMNIGLSFNGSTAVSGAFELYQNQPNPFKDETMISFNLPEAGFASLTVYDVSGKLLHRVEGEFAQGFNQVSLNRSDLAATGVVYYQLDTENDSATKKMIIIK